MTDKQIIDGSDCGYYNKGICWNEDVAIKHCAECDYCYHKTVKALREQLEAYKMEAEEGKEINAELKAENEELKNFHINLVGVKECEIKELLKLKQTLTEIKEIAEKCCIMQAILDCENYDDCTQCGRTSDGEGIQQILQKISEVIE